MFIYYIPINVSCFKDWSAERTSGGYAFGRLAVIFIM